MFDDDLYSSLLNSFSSTTTETEEDKTTTTSYNPSTNFGYNPYSDDSSYNDDYTVTQNYETEKSYESNKRQDDDAIVQTKTISQMNTPMIQKDEPAVVLTKTKQRIYLQARMKIIIAMFATIVCSLLFVSIFNFVNVSRINSSIAEKQATISELESSILDLQATYNLLSEDGTVKNLATNSGFVDSSDINTTSLSIGEVYTEPVIEELPSNWFNDVCDFFSNLFAA